MCRRMTAAEPGLHVATRPARVLQVRSAFQPLVLFVWRGRMPRPTIILIVVIRPFCKRKAPRVITGPRGLLVLLPPCVKRPTRLRKDAESPSKKIECQPHDGGKGLRKPRGVAHGPE